MAEEKKSLIPLDAPLDINSDDMIVHVDKPKWSFNRQRHLAGVATNSVRYEADGWFAGWHVHNFELLSLGEIIVEPNDLGEFIVRKQIIPGTGGHVGYQVKVPQVDLEFYLHTEGYANWSIGHGATDVTDNDILRVDDQTVRISGITSRGTSFIVDMNAYTGAVIPGTLVVSDPAGNLTAVGAKVGSKFRLTVSLIDTGVLNEIRVRFGSNAQIFTSLFTYQYVAATGKHQWCYNNVPIYEYTSATNTLVSLNPTRYAVISVSPVTDSNLITEAVNAVVSTHGQFLLTATITGKLQGFQIAFDGFTKNDSSAPDIVDATASSAQTQSAPVTLADYGAVSYTPGRALLRSFDVSGIFYINVPTWIRCCFTGIIKLSLRAQFPVPTRTIAQSADPGTAPARDVTNPTPPPDTIPNTAYDYWYYAADKPTIQSIVGAVTVNGVTPVLPYRIERNDRISVPAGATLIYTVVQTVGTPAVNKVYAYRMDYTAGTGVTGKALKALAGGTSIVKGNYATFGSLKKLDFVFNKDELTAGLFWQHRDMTEYMLDLTKLFCLDGTYGTITDGDITIPIAGAATDPAAIPLNHTIAINWINKTDRADTLPVYRNYLFAQAQYVLQIQNTSIAVDAINASIADMIDPLAVRFVATATPTWPPRPPNMPPVIPWPLPGMTLPPPAQSFSIGPDIGPSTVAAVNFPNKRYVVLNRGQIDSNDKRLSLVSETYTEDCPIRINIPLCINAYSYFKIICEDAKKFVNGQVTQEAFKIQVLRNNEVGVQAFRLDDGALGELSETDPLGAAIVASSLGFVKPFIQSALRDPTTSALPLINGVQLQAKVRVLFTNSGSFDKTQAWNKTKDNGSDKTDTTRNLIEQVTSETILHYGYYPNWILGNDDLKDLRGPGYDYWREYTAFDGIARDLNARILFYELMQSQNTVITGQPDPAPGALDDLANSWLKTALTKQTDTQILAIASALDTPPLSAAPKSATSYPVYMTFDYVVSTVSNPKIVRQLRINIKNQRVDTDNPPQPNPTYIPDPLPGAPFPFYLEGLQPKWETDPDLSKMTHTFGACVGADAQVNIQLQRAFILNATGAFASATLADSTTDNLITLGGLLPYTIKRSVGIDVGNTGQYRIAQSQWLTTNAYVAYLVRENKAVVDWIAKGITASNDDKLVFINVEVDNAGNITLTLEYDGKEYTVTISADVAAFLAFNVADIRKRAIEQSEIYRVPAEQIVMFIKQAWSNNAQEPMFWWIASDAYLQLRDDSIVLCEPEYDEDGRRLLHDWNGDRWRVVKSGRRGIWLDNTTLNYGVSNAYKCAPVFYKLGMKDDNTLRINVLLNLRDQTFNTPEWTTVDVRVESFREFGQKLADKHISSFNNIDLLGLLGQGDITCTRIDNKLLLGLKLTRGLQQWTIVLTVDETAKTLQMDRVINGYGIVGHNGTLTGGQIPEQFCDTAMGLNEKVYSIADFTGVNGLLQPPYNQLIDIGGGAPGDRSIAFVSISLNDERWEKLDVPDPLGMHEPLPFHNKIFCNTESYHFVYENIDGIISHMTYDFGSHDFVMHKIPVAMNYSCAHGYEGAKGTVLFDTIPQAMSFLEVFGLGQNSQDDSGSSDAANNILGMLSGIALPSLWFMLPKFVACVYGVHALENCGYVVRTSLPLKSEDGKYDKDVYIQRFIQKNAMYLNLGKTTPLIALLLSLVNQALEAVSEGLTANAAQAASTPDDTSGRKLGDFIANATLDAVSASLSASGLMLAVNTSVIEQIGTQFFYTLTDSTQNWSGPGFVNIMLLGQAYAQGMNSVRMNMKKMGAYMPFKLLSKITIGAQLAVSEAIIDGLIYLNQAVSGYQFNTSFGSIPIGSIVGGITAGTIQGMLLVQKIQRTIYESIDDLYANIGTNVRGYSTGAAVKNATDIEALHWYGNKPMTFFYPAYGVTERQTIKRERIAAYIDWSTYVRVDSSARQNFIMVARDFHPYNTSAFNRPFMRSGMPIDPKPLERPFYIPKATCIIPPIPLTDADDSILPEKMAVVEGVVNMLPSVDTQLHNLQINCVNYTFPTPPIHDYQIDEEWDIGVTAANGFVIGYSCKDTKILDGPASNIVIEDGFCGIASAYQLLEIKQQYDPDYLRPWAITPDTIALNISGVNTVHAAKAYHGFDGQFNRIVSWKGGNGLDVASLVQQYCFVANDHFKRSTIAPPSEFFGLFNGPPSVHITTLVEDKLVNQIQELTKQKGLDINVAGEDRDALRYSVPIHAELLSTLPAMVRMLAPYQLYVIDGITSITTDLRNNQSKYKAPPSIDFNIYDKLYRATQEYIGDLKTEDAVVVFEEKVPSAGLTFIGATTKEGFFYSEATRMYYSFAGGDLSKKDVFTRFKNIKEGRWDFVNQEVMFKALHKDGILLNDTIGNMILRLDGGQVLGEMYPPNETIYNERSDFKLLSMPGGTVYQGPRRCAVNRYIILDDMVPQINRNKKRWEKLQREEWEPMRNYRWLYEDFRTTAPAFAVQGWTHNPWRAATAMQGVDEEHDCLFEWEITFAWTDVINQLFEQNEFISFNVMGELYAQGGILKARPTHIFLHKELFKTGYYSMRYASKNGVGNRERLYMWGDGVCAVSSVACYTKELTKRRTQPLATSQVDVQELIEQ